MYADDSQVYVTTPAKDAAATVARLSVAITDINDWMKAGRLRLNPSKTQVMWLGTKRQLDKITFKDIPLLSTVVPVVDSARNLGVNIDSQLSMDVHVAAVCRSGYYQLRHLRPLTRSLSAAAAETVVHAFIASRLDYCNALLYGVSDRLMCLLQSVQNAAARLVTGAWRCDHITPILRQLHWLPLRQRVLFKIAVLVFQCLAGQAPSYLSEERAILLQFSRQRVPDLRPCSGKTPVTIRVVCTSNDTRQ